MSMSQEEIESLMNGLDFEDDNEASEKEVEISEPQGNMSEDDINELIAQTEDIANTESKNDSETVDDILSSLENSDALKEDSNTESNEANIDDILKELEQTDKIEKEVVEEKIEIEEPTIEETIAISNEKVSEENIDELLSTIDEVSEVEVKSAPVIEDIKIDDKDDIDLKINSGAFPLPVEEDTKVVNQLSEVANDTEEKATKIFDVLSNILDYNNAIQNDIKVLNDFSEKQTAMLTSLSQKFPNIEAFKVNLEEAQAMGNYISNVNDKLNDGNTEIFQAMELMQYHDINRQKIERVMSVIRKLSTYLNNLFEDEGSHKEVAVAKHIHGDNSDDLVDDEDLESLIAEFNK